ncbi:hypothetical protein FYJ92_08840 [Pseudarthrobacter sp. NBSH8]|nr:hypothetical protein FYJ92_08840 [Pseudarthrobacter sp. NBSH8]
MRNLERVLYFGTTFGTVATVIVLMGACPGVVSTVHGGSFAAAKRGLSVPVRRLWLRRPLSPVDPRSIKAVIRDVWRRLSSEESGPVVKPQVLGCGLERY